MNLDELKAKAQGRTVPPAEPAPQVVPAAVSLTAPGASGATEALTHFLATVLPSSGAYAMAEIEEGHGARHTSCTTAAELAAQLARASAQGRNVYFALASFELQNGRLVRKRGHVRAVHSLWLDVDVGKGGGNGYATEEEADAALDEFFTALGVAPTFVVHSGAGRHVYWAFDRDLSRDDWSILAKALKTYSARWGLKADGACTADAARVLRAPGTRTKHDNVARVLREGAGAAVEAMRDALEQLRQVAQSKPLQAPSVTAGPVQQPDSASDNDVLLAGIGRVEWLSALPPARQLALLDETMSVCPDSFWSDEPKWAQAVHAIAALDHLPQDARLDLLVKHSQRSPKWEADGWTRERLYRDKWRGANGTATLTALIQTAQENGWVAPVDAAVQLPAANVETLEAHLADRYIFVTEQGAYFNHKTRSLIAPESVAESESWRAPSAGDKVLSVRSLLRRSKKVQRVDAMMYMPGEPAIFQHGTRTVANRWTPYDVDPLIPAANETLALNDFLAHLFPDSEGQQFKKWLMQAMSWLLKHPSARLPVAVLLAGGQGSGKSTMLETIPRLLFGVQNVASVTQGELDSPFTDWLADARILAIPELRMASARDARRVADALKPIITDPSVRIHPKGAKGYQQPNVLSVFASSNHQDAVYLEDDDRRWHVYASPAGRMPDELAERLLGLLNGPRGAGVLRHLFDAVDVQGFKPHRAPPVSAAKAAMTEASKNPIEASLHGRFSANEFPFDRPVFCIRDCQAALFEDGVDLQGKNAQTIAQAIRGRPIAAVMVGRIRTVSRSEQRRCNPLAGARGTPRQRVYVSGAVAAVDPGSWKSAGEDFIRAALLGQGDANTPVPTSGRGSVQAEIES